MKPLLAEIDRIISLSLDEDIGRGDITSQLTIPEEKTANFTISPREDIILCGLDIAVRVFDMVSPDITLKTSFNDGNLVKKSDIVLSGSGNALAIMAAERVALNLLRQLSGVATNTARFVAKTKGTKAKILDTRKTIPGLRSIQKYAVTTGGGINHRFCLDDGILIKDNHISICGSITNALTSARKQAPLLTKIEVECDSLIQVKEALEAGADIIMLDNMDLATIKEAVKMVEGRVPLEASGNVNINTVEDIALAGVDFISVGSITHSPLSVDIGLDIEFS
jgi:nicotinate-nucleotide pyrophosphorylase (carboxylating)